MSTMKLSAKMDRTDSGTPWGFRMAGGKDFGSPLIIQKVAAGSLAAKCGLQVGDTIVRIGATPAESLRHKEAQQHILDAGNSLELALERGGRGRAPQVDNFGYASSSAVHSGSSFGPPQSSLSAAPGPFGDGVSYGNSVSSVTPQTASLRLGSGHSGTEIDEVSSSMLHDHPLASDKHDNNLVLHPVAVQAASLKTAAVSEIADKSTAASSPVQEVTGTKPVIGKKPSLLQGREKEDDEIPIKFDITGRQTDIGQDDTIGVHVERKTLVIPSSNKCEEKATRLVEQSGNMKSPGSDIKKYYPSETYKIVQEQDEGVSQAPINPLTGSEIKTNQSRTLMSLDQTLAKDDTIDMPVGRKTVVIPSSKMHLSSTNAPSGPPGHSAPMSRPAAWQPVIPTGPRKMRVGKAGEAKSLPAVLGGVRIPVCNSCGVAVRGPFVSALDKTWCPDHFICANPHCSVPLINCGFVEEEGQLFCERDYEQYFAPHCGKCGRAIIGTVCSAMEQKFHVDCFTCFFCHQPIRNGLFHLENGEPYCDEDWAAMFQTKCYGCQFPIEPGDRWVEALNQNWHSECFNCSTCQVNLEGQSFFAKGGKPYCKKHSAGGRY